MLYQRSRGFFKKKNTNKNGKTKEIAPAVGCSAGNLYQRDSLGDNNEYYCGQIRYVPEFHISGYYRCYENKIM